MQPDLRFGQLLRITPNEIEERADLCQNSLRPAAVRVHSGQVQELLWRRYPDLRDLQYSCWKVKSDEAMCSACSQCLRLALGALAVGADPSVIGINWSRLMRFARKWQPRHVGDTGPLWPLDIVRRELNSHVVRCIQQTGARQVTDILGYGSPLALARYQLLRRRVRRLEPGAAPGFRSGFVPWLDNRCAAAVSKVYADYFPAEAPSVHADTVDRTRRMVEWITAPLPKDQKR